MTLFLFWKGGNYERSENQMTLLEKLENFEHDITESWYSDVYIVDEERYIKAPLVEVERLLRKQVFEIEMMEGYNENL